jgi:diguanylate cyclase (GGDEF)-like protein
VGKLLFRLRFSGSICAFRLALLISEVVLLLVALIYPGQAIEDLAFGLLILFYVVAIAWGVRRYSPKVKWPFQVLVASGLVFAAEMYLRAMWRVGIYLRIDKHSVLVNLFATIGYVLLLVAVGRFGKSDSSKDGGSLDLVLDGTMAALSVLAVVWLFLVNPTLTGRDIGIENELFFALYPMLSILLVVIFVRVVLSERRVRGRAYWFLLFAMISIFAGDILTLVVAVYDLPISLIDSFLPYVVATILASIGVTDPSMVLLVDPKYLENKPKSYRSSQIALISIALVLPAVLAWGDGSSGFADHVAWFLIDLSLVFVAVVRFRRAMTFAKATEERLRRIANEDELTKLPNRRRLLETLDASLVQLRQGEYLTVAFVDIDQFKMVNDSYGHSVGDKLLCLLGRRLSEHLKSVGEVGRLSGDEFVVIFRPERSLQVIEARARSLQMALGDPVDLDGTLVYVSASIGLSIVDSKTDMSPEQILQGADTAMYEAKSRGRNSAVLFEPSMHTTMSRKLALRNELAKAVSASDLSLVYQPIVSLEQKEVVGVEALSRWQSLSFGQVSPGEFIPVAEEMGLIGDLGRWAIKESLRQRGLWNQRGLVSEDFYISVNLSALQLVGQEVVVYLQEAMDTNNLRGLGVTVEVTESSVMKNYEQSKCTLRSIRNLGIAVAVDDFGTAYSSLAYLKDMSFDILKIDKSFVDALGDDRSGTGNSIVAAIIAMAKALGVKVIAEGVERRSQLESLYELGCDLVQGFYFSEPLRAADFEATVSAIEERLRFLQRRPARIDRSGP